MPALLPSNHATQADYAAYQQGVPDDYEPVKPNMSPFEEAEMDAALALVPRADATKVFAVDDGNWNTEGNWYPSGVPGPGAIVLIGEGCTCTYNLSAPLTELFAVRVDGTLKTDPTIDTAMLFDTMVITPRGLFRDGTRTARVANDVIHQWIIATSNGLIDVGWDTFMQSRGIINLGQGDVWGSYKTPFLEVTSYSGPGIGAETLTLASTPVGWAVGDEIVIGATRCAGVSHNGWTSLMNALQSEKRTLTSVAGAVFGWTGGLTYNHAGPQGTTARTDCKAFVVNLTRNVVFRPDDPEAPIHHRGHLMQMHNPLGWSMRDAEIADLGRTAKHGSINSTILLSNAGAAADESLDLSDSDYWNGSAIVFGPTFLLRMNFTASGAGTCTITGTDEDGAPQEEELDYPSGANSPLINVKYFLTVTAIEFTTAFASNLPKINIEARARQRNENGVRNMNTSRTAGDWTYSTIKNTVNLQGRYPFHWHKMGIMGDILKAPPVLDGVSIHGSPGWGVAQHQAHGNIKNCVLYDCFGAGLVAEDSQETGLWENNVVMHSLGNGDGTHKDAFDLLNSDFARSGAAFWFTGRMPKSSRNVAVGCAGAHIYNTRPRNTSPVVPPSVLDQPTAYRGITAVGVQQAPLAHFVDNIAIACDLGFHVIKASPEQLHDLRTVLLRYRAWSCPNPIDNSYTSHYTMKDCDVLRGFVDGSIAGSTGMSLNGNTSDQVFINPVIEGYTTGIELNHLHTDNTGGHAFAITANNGRTIVNPTFTACTNSYNDFNYEDDIGQPSYSGPYNIDFELDTGDLNSDPISLTISSVTATGVTGTKHDEIGDVDYPTGIDVIHEDAAYTRTKLLTALGYYVDTDSNKYVMMDEWFTSRVTGEVQKIIVPVDVTSGVSLVGMTNHGAMDLANNTPPVLADFSVSLTRNTNLDINIAGRATGSTVRFGGFTRPMKTHLINNGDGTITAIPLTDENYTETCYVWVDDVNGNTTRATMTLNVEK